MKKIFRTLFVAICATGTAFTAMATVRTVNNATIPVNPGQYSTIAAAVTASSAGDTILVAGSATPYDAGTLTINKRLVLIGSGYNPKGANNNSTKVSGIVSLVNVSSNGSTIMGFEFLNTITFTGSSTSNHSNITFARNYFNFVSTGGGVIACYNDSTINCQFINNVFGSGTGIAFYSSTITATPKVVSTALYNNVFLNPCTTYTPSGSTAVTASIYCHPTNIALLTVDHNLFLYGSNATPLNAGTTNMFYNFGSGNTVSNNIFYNCNPNGALNYQNNITYSGSTMTTLPYAGSTGSGNMSNTNPLMTTLFSTSSSPYLNFNADNLNLQSGSPCLNAATDGTNIGPTGGYYPIYATNAIYLTGEPAIPSVTQITATGGTTVPAGTNLNITVTGKKTN